MSNILNIKKKLKVVVPKTWTNNKKGKFWEKIVEPLFSELRWQVIGDIEFEGMQTDIYVKDLITEKRGLVECKFEEKNISPSIIHQLMGQAEDEEVEYAYLISTSELTPKAKAVIEKHKNKDTKNKKYYLEFLGTDKLVELFIKIYNIQSPDFGKFNIDKSKIEKLTLLLTHSRDFVWIADEIGQDGDVYRIIIFSTTNNNWSIDEWKQYFSQHELYWASLDIAVVNDGKNILQNNAPVENIDITISEINEADSFDDYHRPCRPEDFFGMINSQDKFWDFIKKVRDKKTKLRVVCFPGITGIGKSSLLLKLASDCFSIPEYQNSFYIYHVDVTSVDPSQSTLFIPRVITKALQTAINDKFIDLPNHKISTILEPPFFSTESIQLALDNLKNNNRVLIIFFDQFEEIIIKENLSSLFNIFKRLGYEIDSLKENIILGFCWRTDINIPMEDPRYHIWQELGKIRKDIEFDNFSYQDSLKLLDRFSEYLSQNGKRLDPKIKKWLSENCHNLPWLIKKLCGDIYNQNIDQRQISSGNKKLITKFDIEKIFESDIQRYINNNPEHSNCLEYIAKQSPVPKIEVCHKFNSHVINRLIKAKIIIETGNNYKIYWDIFRDFIIDGTLPKITITYRPRTKISTLLRIFRLINSTTTSLELVEITKYKKSTIDNAIQDLQNFFQVEKDTKSNKIIAPENLINLQDYELAEHLADQIEDHIVIREIYENLIPDQYIWEDDFKKLLRKIYYEQGSVKPESITDYTSKMLSWFWFTGLLEKRQTWLIARPIRPRYGKQKGKASECDLDKPKISKSYVTPGHPSLLDLLDPLSHK
ncbi:restriction endonuclease [Anabaena cylindrica FACHB-243]|uniref:Restriction endonuclease type IV Mrr domain-containing protein n=1 Tax=Anabaena cylindrica (strain ATCC 27899 / PCC 7122) TaxID=272123 RepID=K9ZB56_ANACC|nr:MULTISPECIES: restriction endonuclease [Anabaena]AFZ56411.1 hypothetical protein Anacy_0832 [Anabaena cylindrica PCC 7122]MBD2418138.1 restriction endonuclease [Anabaena cylindrica FACHB-243]MBY5281984.1 restriction endonuclease [Anabaena sp. CCAP 1446/1C]MBY5309256.1 restriction endonuclease [Anabaena sp. CCAP 1446/1C]MCM2407417.1 restriction endonuclease [Anabaena sp. CCAP 1446/1C]